MTSEQAVQATLAELEKTQAAISDRVQQLGPEDWVAGSLQTIIDQHIEPLSVALNHSIERLQREAAEQATTR